MLKGLILFALISCVVSQSAFSTETDQFTPPPVPLEDLGPLISKTLYQTLLELQKVSGPETTSDQIIQEFYNTWGKGLPWTQIERWVNTSSTLPKNAVYKLKQRDSVYKGLLGFPTLATLHVLAPTINMYGVYFGIDKLGHIVQQGYSNYTLFNKFRDEGLTPEGAQTKAVTFSIRQERGYFGTALDGVYSNGDLAGDFAGFKFYQNLFNTIKIGDHFQPPLFIKIKTRWTLNPEINPEDLLRPFITDHLNEMLNPSLISFYGDKVRKNLCSRADALRRARSYYPHSTDVDISKWNGEDYGHDRGPGQALFISRECPEVDAESIDASKY